MREIKFRAWDKQGELIDGRDVVIQGDGSIGINDHIDDENFDYANKNSFILEQYTGLHDKNGKEIYENDIVHFNANGLSGLGIVFWEQSTCQFAIKDIRRGRTDRTYPFWKDQKYVVKSNIHENADLLEAEK